MGVGDTSIVGVAKGTDVPLDIAVRDGALGLGLDCEVRMGVGCCVGMRVG